MLIGIALSIVGCGSSGGSAAGDAATGDAATSCSASLSPGASMSWQDDGTAQCADLVSATYDASSASTVFSIVGTAPGGLGISFGVTTTAGGITIGGGYSCGSITDGSAPGALLSFIYEQETLGTFAAVCSIEVHSPDGAGGAPATGTFSAMVTLPGGATRTISNGVFSSPVTVVGG